jgi:hypothetical protein
MLRNSGDFVHRTREQATRSLTRQPVTNLKKYFCSSQLQQIKSVLQKSAHSTSTIPNHPHAILSQE